MLYESENKIMHIIWENESIKAKEIAYIANEKYGWNKNTTYTVLNKLVKKGYISRKEPDFICCSKIREDHMKQNEIQELINRLFKGSKLSMVATFLKDESISKEELDLIKKMIEEKEND